MHVTREEQNKLVSFRSNPTFSCFLCYVQYIRNLFKPNAADDAIYINSIRLISCPIIIVYIDLA